MLLRFVSLRSPVTKDGGSVIFVTGKIFVSELLSIKRTILLSSLLGGLSFKTRASDVQNIPKANIVANTAIAMRRARPKLILILVFITPLRFRFLLAKKKLNFAFSY